jgi:hypothetical protein
MVLVLYFGSASVDLSIGVRPLMLLFVLVAALVAGRWVSLTANTEGHHV